MTERGAYYDAFADVYNRYWGSFAGRVMRVLDHFGLDDLAPGDRLLDVCCGTGQLAALLLERNLEVSGIDSSAEMIKIARVNAPGAGCLDEKRLVKLSHLELQISRAEPPEGAADCCLALQV